MNWIRLILTNLAIMGFIFNYFNPFPVLTFIIYVCAIVGVYEITKY